MTLHELYTKVEGDYEAAKRTLMMDSLIGKMIVRFPEDPNCGRMLEAGKTMDAAGLFEGAHALKGVAGSLGLAKLSAMAGEITEEFREGRPRSKSDDEVREKLEEVRRLYETTLEAIKEYTAG